jgi:hypothetical protein
MSDVVVVAVLIGFFLVCVLYVQWCDHIIDADASGESGEMRR